MVKFGQLSIMLDCAFDSDARSLLRFAPLMTPGADAESRLLAFGERLFATGRPQFAVPDFDLIQGQGKQNFF